jgi:hypothetical protein
MKPHLFHISVMALALAGCASTPTPDSTELTKLPVVPFGQPVPADGDYVLHFPAGVAIATPVTFKGDLFERSASELVTVKPARDIYLHKQWLSYDGQHWMEANSSIDLDIQVVLPGYDHPDPGYIRLEMNAME